MAAQFIPASGQVWFATRFLQGSALADGALVYLTSTSGSPVGWDAEVYDRGGYWVLGASTRLTVPAAGLHRAYAGIVTNVASSTVLTKNGGSFFGRAGAADLNGTSSNVCSAPVTAAAADYFEVTAPGTIQVSGSYFGIEKLPASLKYAAVKRTTNFVTTSLTLQPIAYDAEEADTDGFHDNATNPSRLTVPAGIPLVRLTACDEFSASSIGSQLRKNGADFIGQFARFRSSGGLLSFASAVLEVANGDYFENNTFTNGAKTLLAADGTWFAIEQIPSSYARVLARKSANQAFTSGVTTALNFDGVDVYDTHSMHDPASNNSRLVVPPGFSEAQLMYNVAPPAAVNNVTFFSIRMNGAGFTGQALDSCNISSAYAPDCGNGITPWIPVNPAGGDFFELMCTAGANFTMLAGTATWFCLICR